ncbi:MAG: glycyl-radical enzyme activating protein [Chloroflexi bacterium]|nr:glycyl-radical enzyme activating protein [Chloroflexota bacterium]
MGSNRSPGSHTVASEAVTGWIFDVKRFAVHDGPGVRTVLFFKGCPLRCAWCHNPESISRNVQIMFHPQRCIACLACVEACPHGAQQVTPDGERWLDRSRCELDRRCVEVCYAGALEVVGRRVSVDDVLAQVREDASFYATSGGGVTLSGGEPLLQPEFATAVLRQCKAEEFHTALDTCGQVRWKAFEQALPFVDLVLYDVKHMSAERHKHLTGASSRLILDNLRKLGDHGVPIEIRMVIVPTINDGREFIEAAGEFLGSLHTIEAVRLLPYHRLAGSKYLGLGQANTMPEVETPSLAHMQQIAGRLSAHGLKVIAPD